MHYGDKNGGLLGDGSALSSAYLKKVYNGLSKLELMKKIHRLPVLQHKIRKVREVMCIYYGRDRMMWALWLTKWQGVFQGSDLQRSEAEHKRAWSPGRNNHRGLLNVDQVSVADGLGCSLRVQL